MDTLFSKAEILQQFNISSATLDNWIRTSIPDAFINNQYNAKIIQDFIQSSGKLNARANKKKNVKIEISPDLLAYLKDTSWVYNLAQYFENNNCLGEDIIALMDSRELHLPTISPLDTLIPNDDFYAYGVAYQILLSAGSKSEKGAYYTPKPIVQNIVQRLVSKNKTFLEPCAGVGFFAIEYILEYHKQFNQWPENLIYINELDPIAAQICEKTIHLATRGELKSLFISQGDGLVLSHRNIDLVITNPPYGIKNKYTKLKSTEIFTHFIHKCMEDYLTDNGILHFVLPSAVLYVEKHKEIRQYILEEQSILSIENYGRGFADVFSDIISLEISKTKPTLEHVIQLDNSKKVNQKSLQKNSFIIKLTDDKENSIIDKYYKHPHITLANCTFALGIVTGNNKLFLSSEPLDGYSKVISGKEVKPGYIALNEAQYILNDADKYQQHPPMNLFLRKKIVYKFISKNIISAVDKEGSLTLNSANFFILNDVPVSEEYVSAILNSQVMQQIFQTQYGNPIKVLKKQIQELPIFIFTDTQMKNIEENYKLGKHLENDHLISSLLL